jgi:MFS family permease
VSGDGVNGRAGRVILGAAAALFLATIVSAALVLPGQVEVYFTPTDRPDVVYETWQYLALVAVGAFVVALVLGALASTITSVVQAFGPGRSSRRSQVGTWVVAWSLLWFSAAVWLVIWLGNDQPERRSTYELLVVVTGLVGAGVVTALRVRAELRGPGIRRTET